ncbi:response regulator [Paraburkholderia sp. DHOC27]|nr:response regulator [Paraburkholderia sp. DHOC27]
MSRHRVWPAVRNWTGRSINVTQHQLRLLVVDDNKNAADAMAAYLMSEDIDSRVAYGGAEAVAKAIEWKPQIILMDISMPECNGFEASLTLRNDKRTSHIAIVAHTALDEAEVRSHLSDSEFDGYSQKGQPLARLLDLIKSFLQ